jgi:hypothetical protein
VSFIVAEYLCPEHGRFDELVERQENGEAPDAVQCPCPINDATCGLSSSWTISAPLGRVKIGEVTQGKVRKAEVPTWTDTEPLANGMSVSDWKKKRAKTWRDHRYRQNRRDGFKGMA